MTPSLIPDSLKYRFLGLITFANLAWLSLIVVSLGMLVSSYIDARYSETVSFFVQDGWCVPQSQGFGSHCFGDFYAPITIASDINPWASNLNLAYSPVSFAYFNLISNNFFLGISLKFPLYLNIFLTLLAISLPGLQSIKQNLGGFAEAKWILTAMLTATPSLALIDRGSNNFLLIPFLYFYVIAIRSQRMRNAFLILVLMSLWKPQMFIFAFLFLTTFGFKEAIKVSLVTFAAILASFVLYPNGVLTNISDWISNSRSYQTYSPIPGLGNYSFANFVGYIDSVFRLISDDSGAIKNTLIGSMNSSTVSLISILFGIFAFGSLYLARNKVSQNYQILATTIFFLLIPGTTFVYYLALLLVPLIFITRDGELRGNLPWLRTWAYLTYGLLLFTLVPAWPVSFRNIGSPLGQINEQLGVHLLLSHVLLCVLAVLIILDCALASLPKKVSIIS